jgi:hypothetical protein
VKGDVQDKLENEHTLQDPEDPAKPYYPAQETGSDKEFNNRHEFMKIQAVFDSAKNNSKEAPEMDNSRRSSYWREFAKSEGNKRDSMERRRRSTNVMDPARLEADYNDLLNVQKQMEQQMQQQAAEAGLKNPRNPNIDIQKGGVVDRNPGLKILTQQIQQQSEARQLRSAPGASRSTVENWRSRAPPAAPDWQVVGGAGGSRPDKGSSPRPAAAAAATPGIGNRLAARKRSSGR